VQRQSPDGFLKNPELSVSAGSGALRAGRNRSDASVLSLTDVDRVPDRLPTTLRRLTRPFSCPIPP
jgi:hypothetical protein